MCTKRWLHVFNMPKLEPKHIQKELEAGKLRPVYWFYGTEAMKSRELLKRIRTRVLGENAGTSVFGETVLDAQDCDVSEVVDAAQSLSLMGGTKFVVVKQAHLLKDPEPLMDLCTSEFMAPGASVTVFLSKDLDQRKKFSKFLMDKAACVACEETREEDREAWTQYLAKQKAMTLTPAEATLLSAMDPWSLDGVERELEKMESAVSPEDREAVLLGGAEGKGASEIFVEAILLRDRVRALPEVRHFAGFPEHALPLMGLLAWNVKMLVGVLKDRDAGTRDTKIPPFLQDRIARYQREWTLPEAIALSHALCEIDFATKQTPRDPLGFWTDLVLRYCR